MDRRSSEPEKDWANYACTDEMSKEIVGMFGLNHVWRETWEKWHDDCVGAKNK